MREFTVTITDPKGLHSRPSLMLNRDGTKAFKEYGSTVTLITNKGENIDLTENRIMAIMIACIAKGDVITIRIDGGDEATATEFMKESCRKHEFGRPQSQRKEV